MKKKSAPTTPAKRPSDRSRRPTGPRTNDLLLDAPSSRPHDRMFLTAAQFSAAFSGYDQARLRRLSNPDLPGSINPITRLTWIPPLRNAKIELTPTAAGIVAWLEHQLRQRDGLPENYSSKTDFTGLTRFPEAMLDYAIAHGCRCKDDHGRISLSPFLQFFAPLFVKIFSGGGQHIAGMEAFEELDLNVERAGLTREQKLAQARDNAIANERIHDLNHAQARMIELCAPLRELYVTATKKAHRLGPTQPDIYRTILLHDLPAAITRLGQGQPQLANWQLAAGDAADNDFQI